MVYYKGENQLLAVFEPIEDCEEQGLVQIDEEEYNEIRRSLRPHFPKPNSNE